VLSRHTFKIPRKKGSDFFDHKGTLIQNKNENGKTMAKLFHFVLACNLWKKEPELPGQDSATIDVIQIPE